MSSVQEKEIKMATTASTSTLGYANNITITTTNRDSSNSSSSQNQTSSDHHQSHTPTLVFNNNPPPPQNFVYTPPPSTTDPDLRTVTAVPSTAPRIWYRECLRNHAATMGSHVVDGCGEFMPSGDENTPESLKCAACECHRNFHRKEVQRWGEQQYSQSQQHLQYFPTISLPHVSSSRGPVVAQPPLMMAFGGPAAESSSEDLNVVADAQPQPQPKKKKKKRFRTKFSQEQKDKMVELAEKLGWRIQKHDEQEVQQFCSQLGINRQVFKVWMHNNKQPAAGTTKKQQL